MGGLPSEAALAAAWEARAYGARALMDDGGRRLQVVFAGRRWGGPGPDFRGAVLALPDGKLLRGDVEVHRRASGWAEHRHATDPAYDAVVLHVVGLADRPTLDRRGCRIATLELPRVWPAASDQAPWVLGPDASMPTTDEASWVLGPGPCMRTAAVRRVVEAAGRARFRARVARLEGDLAAVEPDQVVWRGVAEALGYTRNTAPFGRLADVVPWSDAAEAVAWRGPLGLAGLLLGTAGLLAEASLAEAHAFRAFERARNARQMLTAAAWDRRQQHAANSPAQRCRGLAELAARWTSSPSSTRVMPALEARTADWPLDRSDSSAQRRAGPTDLAKAAVDWLRDPIGSSAQGGAGPAEKVLAAVGEAARCGRRRPRPLWRLVHAPPWIGRGRAQVVVVNVLVPFAVAAGCVEAAELFERLSGEPTNRVLRYMAAQLGQGTTAPEQVRFTGALLQQGLLQLFSATCATRLCGACPARGASWPWHDA